MNCYALLQRTFKIYTGFSNFERTMEADWPANPECSVICILCKKETPLRDSNPEEYFRHLIRDHSTYFNLNLLLELSLGQPRTLSDFSNSLNSNLQRQHLPSVLVSSSSAQLRRHPPVTSGGHK